MSTTASRTAGPAPGHRAALVGPARHALGQVLKCASLVLAVSALTFFLAKASPMDPVESYLGAENAIDPSQYAALTAKWGLDRPAVEQFVLWWGNALHGDLGTSLMLQRPVVEVIAEGLSNSLMLLTTAWVVSGLFGGALGVIAGKNRSRWPDRLISTVCYVFAALPTFWFGLLMLLLFAVRLGWFPIGLSTGAGVTMADSSLGERIHHMILPALTLSVSGVSSIALQTRARLVQESESDYALFATARGEGPWRFVLRHGLRNCLKPFVTLQFGSVSEIIGGSVLAETVFSYAGLGALTSMAGTKGDLPLLIGITVISATIVFCGNLVANLLYPVIDPRIRQAWA